MRTSLIRRSSAAITLTAALLIPVVACGGDDSSVDPATTPPAAVTDTTPTATEAPAVTEPTAQADPAFTLPVVVYLHQGERLSAVRRHVDTMTTSVTEGTFEMWLAGPTPDENAAGYSTTVPPGTRLLSARSESSIVTVDLSSEFASGGGTASVLGRLAELVMTAATSASVFQGVELLIEGEPVSTFSAEGVVIEGLLTVADVEEQLPAILHDRPLAGDEITDGSAVRAWASTADGSVAVQVLDEAGALIHEQTTPVTCGAGCLGVITAWLELGDHTGPATVRIFQVSPDDGGELDLVTVPVTVAG